jgi:hypothetical protein
VQDAFERMQSASSALMDEDDDNDDVDVDGAQASQSIGDVDIEMADGHLSIGGSLKPTPASLSHVAGPSLFPARRGIVTKRSIAVFPKDYVLPSTNLERADCEALFKVDEAFAQLSWKSTIPRQHSKDDHRFSSSWVSGTWDLLGQYDPESKVGIPHVFRYLLDAVLNVHAVAKDYVSFLFLPCLKIILPMRL